MGRRRYSPIGAFPAYDRLYGGLKSQSPILNVTGHSMSEESLKMGDAKGLETLLIVREGEKNGQYFDPTFGGQYVTARIPYVRQEMEAVDAEFDRMKQSAKNQGCRVPEKMPSDLLNRKLELEAHLDILLEECDILRKNLEAIQSRERKEEDNKVLERGPIGVGKGDPLKKLDGQMIAVNEEGELFIQDSRSPYDGMKVVDYREKIMMPFLQKPKPHLFIGTVKRANLPPWPEDVPRPKKEEDSSAS